MTKIDYKQLILNFNTLKENIQKNLSKPIDHRDKLPEYICLLKIHIIFNKYIRSNYVDYSRSDLSQVNKIAIVVGMYTELGFIEELAQSIYDINTGLIYRAIDSNHMITKFEYDIELIKHNNINKIVLPTKYKHGIIVDKLTKLTGYINEFRDNKTNIEWLMGY